MDPMVGSGGKEENSNSNVISLLEVCCMCNRRFLYDSLDSRGPSVAAVPDEHALKEEDVLLHMFFDDTGTLEKSLLQFCTFCKSLCTSLLETKDKLSKTIDEISKLIRKSKKLSSGSSYLLSKPRVVTRLFQDQAVRNTPSTTYLSASGIPGMETEFTSPAKEEYSNSLNSSTEDDFTPGFPLTPIHTHRPGSGNGNGESSFASSTTTVTPTPHSDKVKGNASLQHVQKAFNFILPLRSPSNSNYSTSTKSPPNPNVGLGLGLASGGGSVRKNVTKVDKSTKPKLSKPLKKAQGNHIALVRNSSTSVRFVLVQEHEENARDVGDSSDNHNANNILAELANQALLGEEGELELELPLMSIPGQTGPGPGVLENSDDSRDPNTNAQLPDAAVTMNFEAVTGIPIAANNDKETKTAKHICPVCSKPFTRKRDFVNHVESHSKVKPYICEICGDSYRHKRGLEAHVAIHRGEGKHKCPHCNQVFTQKSGLKRHLPLHTGESQFQCEECGKSFLHRSSFAHHKLVHNGEKNFQCESCDMAFTSSTHLRRHQRSHTGEKNHSCSICDKPFSEKSNLKAHMRTHTKEVAHPCPHCPKGFNRKHRLERHIYTFHPQDEIVNIDDEDEEGEREGVGESFILS